MFGWRKSASHQNESTTQPLFETLEDRRFLSVSSMFSDVAPLSAPAGLVKVATKIPNVVGTYVGTSGTGADALAVTMVFTKQKGANVQGTAQSGFWPPVTLKGTIVKNKFVGRWTAGPASGSFQGKLVGKTISGTATINTGGQVIKTSFSVTKS